MPQVIGRDEYENAAYLLGTAVNMYDIATTDLSSKPKQQLKFLGSFFSYFKKSLEEAYKLDTVGDEFIGPNITLIKDLYYNKLPAALKIIEQLASTAQHSTDKSIATQATELLQTYTDTKKIIDDILVTEYRFKPQQTAPANHTKLPAIESQWHTASPIPTEQQKNQQILMNKCKKL